MPTQTHQQHVRWINSKGGGFPIGSSLFDDNWEPDGHAIRAALKDAGLIEEAGGTLSLTDAGRALV